MYTRRLSTSFGVVNDASKFWKPPMPTRFIHSKSSLIPSLVMLPFIQCHHTRGLAEFGGFLNPSSREAGAFCAKDEEGDRHPATAATAIARMHATREWL